MPPFGKRPFGCHGFSAARATPIAAGKRRENRPQFLAPAQLSPLSVLWARAAGPSSTGFHHRTLERPPCGSSFLVARPIPGNKKARSPNFSIVPVRREGQENSYSGLLIFPSSSPIVLGRPCGSCPTLHRRTPCAQSPAWDLALFPDSSNLGQTQYTCRSFAAGRSARPFRHRVFSARRKTVRKYRRPGEHRPARFSALTAVARSLVGGPWDGPLRHPIGKRFVAYGVWAPPSNSPPPCLTIRR